MGKLKEKEQVKSLWRIWLGALQNMHKENPWLTVSIVLGTLGAVVVNYFPVLFQQRIISALVVKSGLNQLLVLALVYFVIMVVASSMMALADGYSKSRFSLVRLNYMAKLDRKLLEMDYPYWENEAFLNGVESTLQCTSSNNTGYEYLLHMAFKMPAVWISILLLTGLIAWYQPLVLLGLILHVGVAYWVRNAAQKMRFEGRKKEQSAQRRVSHYAFKTSDFTFGKDIRIFALADLLKKGYKQEIGRIMDLITLYQNKEFKWGLWAVLAGIISDILLYGSLIYGARRGMPVATFAMLLSAAATLSLLLTETVDDISKVKAESRYVDAAQKFLASDLGDGLGDINEPLVGPLKVEFRNVGFTYPGSDTPVFEDLSFTIQPEEKLAIVGVNGAGKTTLVKLLTGLFRPQKGEIFLNDIPQSCFSKKALYAMFSCVFQDVVVLPFDVKTNIVIEEERLKELGQGDEPVWQALDMAGLKERVLEMPQGLEQKLNKHVYDDALNLSGGEAQKLTVARALFKDGNMVIMDEPTAALDALAEQAIYSQFNDLVNHKTALYISHRLASTRFCDRILLLAGRDIAEAGTHEELMAKNGVYANMFRVQGKYYKEAANEEV